MGADIKNLRGRIKSVNSTLHLTKAMGLVASSKIRRATQNMEKSKSYMEAVSEVIDLLLNSPEADKIPYMQKRDTNKLCLIVIAGDRGLAGGYNANVFRLAREYEASTVIPIGKRACDYYKKEPCYTESFSSSEAMELAEKLCKGFAAGEFDRVGIICTKYLSIMSQEAYVKWLLPLERKENKTAQSVLFEPDEVTILKTAIFEYIGAIITAAVRESFASEVAARRFAMDSAGKNAQQMLDELHIKYNRARQGAITQEITEIVAGSDA